MLVRLKGSVQKDDEVGMSNAASR